MNWLVLINPIISLKLEKAGFHRRCAAQTPQKTRTYLKIA
jgi:hypothetical protein